MALAEFQLGHLYEKHVVSLTTHYESEDQKFNERFKDHKMENEVICFQKAYGCFERAYDSFKKINHLKGMYLAQKRMKEVCSLKEVKHREAIQKQIDEDHDKYLKYVKENGLGSSLYIPRELEDDISIMTDLSLDRFEQNLFPSRAAAMKRKQ